MIIVVLPASILPLGEIADQIASGPATRGCPTLRSAARRDPGRRSVLGVSSCLDADPPHADYLDWSDPSAWPPSVGPDTQIHTHLCYFGVRPDHRRHQGLDADVTFIEAPLQMEPNRVAEAGPPR